MVRSLLLTVVFIVAVLSSGACALLVLLTLANPYDDITRGWTTLLSGVTGVSAAVAWVGFVLLKRPYRWEPEEDMLEASPHSEKERYSPERK